MGLLRCSPVAAMLSMEAERENKKAEPCWSSMMFQDGSVHQTLRVFAVLLAADVLLPHLIHDAFSILQRMLATSAHLQATMAIALTNWYDWTATST